MWSEIVPFMQYKLVSTAYLTEYLNAIIDNLSVLQQNYLGASGICCCSLSSCLDIALFGIKEASGLVMGLEVRGCGVHGSCGESCTCNGEVNALIGEGIGVSIADCFIFKPSFSPPLPFNWSLSSLERTGLFQGSRDISGCKNGFSFIKNRIKCQREGGFLSSWRTRLSNIRAS